MFPASPSALSTLSALSTGFGSSLCLDDEILGNGHLLVVDVLLHKRLRTNQITNLDGLQDFLMLMHENSALRLVLDVFETITIHLLPKIVDHLYELLVSGGLIDDVMVGFIRLCNLDLRTAIFHDLLEIILRSTQLPKLLVRDTLTGEIGRQLLECATNLQEASK